MRTLTPLLVAASLAIAAQAVAQPDAPPASDEESFVYMMGASLGRNLSTFDLSEREIALVKLGLEDSLRGGALAVDPAKYGPRMNEYVTERSARVALGEKAAADQFVAEAQKRPGAVKTSSGLVFSETKAGNGEKPSATDQVRVHYHGTLADGTVFDSSRGREPAVFRVNDVILCWTEALQRMAPGGTATIVCPADLAYGDRGIPGAIKPGAALQFEVELIGIE